jgi:hypothetical protein
LVNPKEGLFSILLNHCRLVKKLNYCVPKWTSALFTKSGRRDSTKTINNCPNQC